jgi:ABC-type uncharacterized transport system substrate-binding protein
LNHFCAVSPITDWCRDAISCSSRNGAMETLRLPELAVKLVNAGVDVIVAEGVTTVRAARAVTATIPIVVTTGADPFVGGLVKNLARPGGNVTGFTTMSAETSGKVFEVFREVVPGLKRVAVLAPRAAWEIVCIGTRSGCKGARDRSRLRRSARPGSDKHRDA